MIATMGRSTSNCDLHTRPSNAFSQAISPRPTSFLIRDILRKDAPVPEESPNNVTDEASLRLSNEAFDDDSDCYSPQPIRDRGTWKRENFGFEDRSSSQLNSPVGTVEAEDNFDSTFDGSRISSCNSAELSTRYSDILKVRRGEKHASKSYRHRSRGEFRSDSSEKDFVSKNICQSESTTSDAQLASRSLLKREENEEYSSETSGLQRSFFKRLDDELHNGHPFIGNVLLSPANYPMLDFRYGYALGTNGAVHMPNLSHMLVGYRNANLISPNFSTVYNEYIERAKSLISSRTLLSSSIPHQGPRYTLKEPWVKDNHISPHLQSHHHGSSPIGEKRNFYPDSCDMTSDQAPSPCSSYTSVTPPPKPAVHLPVYLRSRLSVANSSSDVETVGANGKPKKCRRSRTVFTELQMLGLEKRFEKQQYLSTPDRVELAELLGLSQLQVKTWYQNRRMKWKKQVLQGGGTEAPTKPKGRPRKIRPEDQANLSNKASQQLNLSKDQSVKPTSPLIINPIT